MAEESGGEKSLPASGQKIQRARADGNIAKSQDLSSGIALAVALMAIVTFGPSIMDTLLAASRYYIHNAPELTPDKYTLADIAAGALWIVALCTLPVALALVLTGVLTNLFQVGILLTAKPMTPKLSRIDPIGGF
ncbi:MAG: EscU/YscU/HrcU family type III secretion system export apparatus switch protein, partial [Gammaproteobacteria bacterium]|nr:EscU/YscU/HrcU family type III secretion system export apparatus switch protein [Gammaproteobacteria bacterium]